MPAEGQHTGGDEPRPPAAPRLPWQRVVAIVAGVALVTALSAGAIAVWHRLERPSVTAACRSVADTQGAYDEGALDGWVYDARMRSAERVGDHRLRAAIEALRVASHTDAQAELADHQALVGLCP